MTSSRLPRHQQIPAVFAALSNSNRRAILEMIGDSQVSATEIGRIIGISQQAVSRHIIVLTRAGLVSRLGWEGYAIDAGGVRELIEYIELHFRAPDKYSRGPVWM